MKTTDAQRFRGKNAMHKMQHLLTSIPKCYPLAERVGDFFGTCLLLTTCSNMDTSRFAPFSTPEEDKVHIKLGMKSDRICEALTHELLHGDLLLGGYPWFDMRQQSRVDPCHDCTLNYVHHALMVSQFESL